MPLKLQYASRCSECGQRMDVGDEFISTTASNGGWIVSHVKCPEVPREARQIFSRFDSENLFTVRKCADCAQVTAFKRPGRLTPICPYCSGSWVRERMVKSHDGNEYNAEGWAA